MRIFWAVVVSTQQRIFLAKTTVKYVFCGGSDSKYLYTAMSMGLLRTCPFLHSAAVLRRLSIDVSRCGELLRKFCTLTSTVPISLIVSLKQHEQEVVGQVNGILLPSWQLQLRHHEEI